MSEKKPVPITIGRKRAVCPVCGKPSYSRSGVHPQCALARADAISRAALKAAQAESAKPAAQKSWVKTCPKCKHQIPARRFQCDCGHRFAAMRAGRMEGVFQKRTEPDGQQQH